MRVAVFSAKPYDRQSLDQMNERFGHELVYYETRLRPLTTRLAEGYPAVCVFVNDDINARDHRRPGCRRHAPDRHTQRRIQPDRSGSGSAAQYHCGARARVLAQCHLRVHRRPHADAGAPDPSRLQPHSREQLRAGRAARLRAAGPHHRHHRHGAGSAPTWPRRSAALAARCWPTTCTRTRRSTASSATRRWRRSGARRAPSPFMCR